MATRTKRASARDSRSRLPIVAAGMVITAASGFLSAPVFAEQPASLVAAVPISSVISTGALVESQIAHKPAAEPIYRTIGSGKASYYGRELAGNRTASGERFNPSGLTAAHRTLPMGSKVRVTNSRTGDSVIVRINDRGPFHGNRLIDLSEAAARQVGIRAAGSGVVELAMIAD